MRVAKRTARLPTKIAMSSMKPLTIHPVSFLLGAIALGCVLALFGQGPPVATAGPLSGQGQVRVAGIPAPQDMVVVREEDGPYTVPPGNLFVLTGFGHGSTSGFVNLHVDGIFELSAHWDNTDAGVGGTTSLLPVPAGYVVRSGSEILIQGTGGRAVGYLAKE